MSSVFSPSCFSVPEDLSVEERDELSNISKTSQRNKQIAMGRKKFNMDPKKGIQFLLENDLLQHTPEDIAQFLYKGEGLNKTVIGDYLGERDDFNIKVLQAFVELHEFADLNLVQALRQFLWSFRLPGEAQKIDRMMEAFASRYCQCNPGVFQSTDTCYVLSFAIIMLNTSLHNPNVRDKPPVERFISMNRGINEGGDLPEELLRVRIYFLPFSIPEKAVSAVIHLFSLPSYAVCFSLAGGRVKTWKRRWFILTDNCLYYFEYTTVSRQFGVCTCVCVRTEFDHFMVHNGEGVLCQFLKRKTSSDCENPSVSLKPATMNPSAHTNAFCGGGHTQSQL
uniref:SEC7 domain-containing protein n=1 Tax=Pundamilia nyererei TaxID=303518 RepID=A0A3B4GSL1_9CICH